MKKIKVLIVTLICLSTIMAFSGCNNNNDSDSSLTITGDGFEKVYTADELLALGSESVTYSGRTKNVENARVFKDANGVDLKTILIDAGAANVDDAIIKATANDGYECEYEVKDLYDEKVAFLSNENDEFVEVNPMICVNEEEGDYPSPFMIIFGQATYDRYDNSAQDFNMQKWGSYLEKIEVITK